MRAPVRGIPAFFDAATHDFPALRLEDLIDRMYGRKRLNLAPPPDAADTRIDPRCSSMIFLQMERPRPVPWPISLVE